MNGEKLEKCVPSPRGLKCASCEASPREGEAPLASNEKDPLSVPPFLTLSLPSPSFPFLLPTHTSLFSFTNPELRRLPHEPEIHPKRKRKRRRRNNPSWFSQNAQSPATFSAYRGPVLFVCLFNLNFFRLFGIRKVVGFVAFISLYFYFRSNEQNRKG